MSDLTNDPQRSMTANLALSKLAPSQATVDRALGPSFRDPMERFRKITARAAVPRRTPLVDAIAKSGLTRTAGFAPLASSHRTLLESFAKPQVQRPPLAALGAFGNHAALSTSPRRRLVESFFARTNVAPEIAALTKVQTGGLATQMAVTKAAPGMEALTTAMTAQMAGPKLAPGLAALTKLQTGGLAASLAGPKAAPRMEALTTALTAQLAGRKLTAGVAALTRAQTGGLAAELAKQHSVTSAIEGMRTATERYATTTLALEPSRRPGYALMEALRTLDAESSAVEVYDREVIKPSPAVRDYAADLVRLQHQAAEQREREQREEVDHRRQSLAVQIAMRDALIASEEAGAADAEASAKREMAALDRAIAAEERAKASDEREAKMLKLTTISVTIGGVSLLVAIAAVIATIIVAG